MLIKWTGTRKQVKKDIQLKTFPKNSWFDDECKLEKKRTNEAKKAFLKDVNEHARAGFFTLKRRYKKLVKQKKHRLKQSYIANCS